MGVGLCPTDMRIGIYLIGVSFLTWTGSNVTAAAQSTLSVEQILQRSVEANRGDWSAAPRFAFVERDQESRFGSRKPAKTYQVLTIDGSPYRRLLAIDDQTLSQDRSEQEARKLRKEAQRRARESSGARKRRIASYQRERKQDQAMMNEMADAFSYSLVGEEQIRGHDTYLLDASPKPGYQPKTRETRVLTGMRGRLWIDKQNFHWVKVSAEVFRPVSFAFFFAKVGPGTKFELEESPVNESVWLPIHFKMSVKASVIGFSYTSSDDETYRDYTPNEITLKAALAK